MLKRSLFAILLLMLISSCLCACRDSGIKYPAGKDTRHLFGDGTFQTGGRPIQVLFYAPDGSSVIEKVESIHETKSYVYVIGYQIIGTNEDHVTGAKQFAVIDLQNNTMQLYNEYQGAIENIKYEVYVSKNAIECGAITVIPDFSCFTEEAQLIFLQMQ